MDLKTVFLMTFYFIASVGIVFCNKIIFHTFHYNYATLLTALHFHATWLGLLLNLWMGQYTMKKLKYVDVAPITLSFWSLVLLDCIHLMKILTTPVVVTLQNIMYGVDLNVKLKLSLVPVCVGVAMATVNDFSFNAVCGRMSGHGGPAGNSVLPAPRQDRLEVNSFQLLYYQAPQSALLVLACTSLFDRGFGTGVFIEFHYTSAVTAALIVSCFLAYCVNLSTYLVIGHTSPVSYQLLGHFKLLVILADGILLFHEDANYVRLTGMGLPFIGIVSYTTHKQNTASEWGKGARNAADIHDTPSTHISDKTSSLNESKIEARLA